ncbi:glycerophosphodiester phosphodiesterase family protein [Proteiniclasticum ruminis]|uniref:Glycerophosphoryl diester phosphodiesterase n=1 Tax=Proteiniclasticum ruminis TaxID=398199 RepID=A0A1I4XLP6_9CLOT|nr:glycerophosphodiester phosphodiesterase family protein [Proteiniclasticum ruminis]SFN26775.1 glycerophosphoryl diester phosphodiesterase [Proteiniclasticum ruminis]
MRAFLESLKDLKNSHKHYIYSGLLYFMVSGLFLVPLFSYLLNRLLLSAEGGVLLNLDVFQILLSSNGLFVLSVLFIIVILNLLVILGTQLILSYQKIQGIEVTVTEAVLTSIRALPRLVTFEFLYLFVFLLLLLPLLELQLSPFLQRFFEMPPLLLTNLQEVRFGVLLYFFLLGGVFYLLVRWIFSFHEVFLARKQLRKALKVSAEMTKGKKLGLVLSVLVLNGVLLGGFFLVLYGLSQLPELFDIVLSRKVREYFITLSASVFFLYFLVLFPVNMHYLTRLYFKLKEVRNKEEMPPIKTVQWHWLMEKEKRLFEKPLRKSYTVLGFLLLGFVGTFVINSQINESLLYSGRSLHVAAHRGDAVRAPENTLSAIESALDLGATLVEMDVQRTKDGVLVLHHDTSLLRMAGVPEPVSFYTYEELSAFDVGAGFSEAFTGERIPTLKEALLLVKGRGGALLDVKVEDHEEETAKEILEILEDLEMKEHTYIQSFQYDFLRAIRAMDEKIQLGQIMYAALGRLEGLSVDFYTVRKSMLTKNLIRRAHEAGRGVFVWVIETEEDLKQVLSYDVDGIITKDVAMTAEVLGLSMNALEEEEEEEEEVSP